MNKEETIYEGMTRAEKEVADYLQEINLFAYPGENPVLDGSNLYHESSAPIGIQIYNTDYWHLKGLEITNVPQFNPSGAPAKGVNLQGVASHNVLEKIVSHHNMGVGISVRGSSTNNTILNCDSYSNFDSLTVVSGGNADGFQIGYVDAGTQNYLIHTRAWNNSDDGYDFWNNDGFVLIDGVWAFQNG